MKGDPYMARGKCTACKADAERVGATWWHVGRTCGSTRAKFTETVRVVRSQW